MPATTTHFPRCVPTATTRVTDPEWPHTWCLTMRCGKTRISHAQEAPVTIACGRQCGRVDEWRRTRPALEW